MAYDVFISHSSRDKPAADAICAALEAARIRCWIAPRDLIPGRAFSGEIMRGIKSCRVMVLVFSANSNTSPDVLREVQLATRHRLHLVNFRIESAPVSEDLDYFLGIPHWLDAVTPPMAEHHAKLAESVKSLLALEPAPRPAGVEDEIEEPVSAHPSPGGAADQQAGSVPASVTRRVEPGSTGEKGEPRRRSVLPLVGLVLMLVLSAVSAVRWWPAGKGKEKAGGDTPAAPFSSNGNQASSPGTEKKPAGDTPGSTSSPGSAAQPAPDEVKPAGEPRVNSLGMKLVPVPIISGPTRGRQVWFSVYETRVQDWMAYERERPGGDQGWHGTEYAGQGQDLAHPVVNVSWDESKAFCAWLTKKERDAGHFPEGLVYRLPTDLEWSSAVGLKEEPGKISEEDIFPWGAQWPPQKGAGNYADASARVKLGIFSESSVVEGNYNDGAAFTAPVGSYQPNAFGLYDLGGNAWEWCDGWSDEGKTYHAVRGASWMVSLKKDVRSGYRSMGTSWSRNIDQGFRIVLAEPLAE